MNYKKITNRIRKRYIINIFLLIGFILVIARLERYFNKVEDYPHNPILVYNELVINDQSIDELIIEDNANIQEGKSFNDDEARNIYSYTFTIEAYNSILHNKYLTILSNHIFLINITSILQMNNIWHASSIEEPDILF